MSGNNFGAMPCRLSLHHLDITRSGGEARMAIIRRRANRAGGVPVPGVGGEEAMRLDGSPVRDYPCACLDRVGIVSIMTNPAWRMTLLTGPAASICVSPVGGYILVDGECRGCLNVIAIAPGGQALQHERAQRPSSLGRRYKPGGTAAAVQEVRTAPAKNSREPNTRGRHHGPRPWERGRPPVAATIAARDRHQQGRAHRCPAVAGSLGRVCGATRPGPACRAGAGEQEPPAPCAVSDLGRGPVVLGRRAVPGTTRSGWRGALRELSSGRDWGTPGRHQRGGAAAGSTALPSTLLEEISREA